MDGGGNIWISEISREPNRQIYTVDFFGENFTTTVTATPSVVRKWIQSTLYNYRFLLYKLVVGLGVQWNPETVSEADTLQLCVGRRCLIFQLSQAESIPKSLRDFLNDGRYTFVGIWNHSDADRLMRSEHQLWLASVPKDLRFDVADRFDEPELRTASMGTLVSRFFGYDGVTKDPEVSMSDWDAYWLTEDQVLYASIDAYVSFQMGKDIY